MEQAVQENKFTIEEDVLRQVCRKCFPDMRKAYGVLQDLSEECGKDMVIKNIGSDKIKLDYQDFYEFLLKRK